MLVLSVLWFPSHSPTFPGDVLAVLSSQIPHSYLAKYSKQPMLFTPSLPVLEPFKVSLAQMFASPASPTVS